MESGPTRESVAKEFPRWKVWQGVCGLKYARLRNVSPAVTAGPAETWAELRERIAQKMAGRLR